MGISKRGGRVLFPAQSCAGQRRQIVGWRALFGTCVDV